MADHNPFRWVEIYVQDMARARKFYETVCKLKLEKLPSPEAELWAFPMAPNAAGAAARSTATSSRSASTALSRWSSTPRGICSGCIP